MRRFLLVVMIAILAPTAPAIAGQKRLALVQTDGTLKVGHQVIRLHGIHIPQFNRFCRRSIRPILCAPRAVLQLEFRVDRFVECDNVARNTDRSVNAICWVDDKNDVLGPRVDLAAWMLYNGWAVATPGAPFEYYTLERIALVQKRGIWGFQADSITFR